MKLAHGVRQFNVDPTTGDAPNKAVREEADLAVKAVFSPTLSDHSVHMRSFSCGTKKKISVNSVMIRVVTPSERHFEAPTPR